MGLVLGKIVGVDGLGKPLGQQRVGRASCRIPGGCWAQIFYPVAADAVGGESELYMRRAACEGMAASLKTPKILMRTWSSASHPFLSGVPLVQGFAGPIVIFQHGLYGNAEIYSKICGDLAANGVVVVACEHEDGSASYAVPEGAAEPLKYDSPPGPYTRESVAAFRRPMLEKRQAEVEAVLRFALADQAKTADTTAASLDDIVLEEETLSKDAGVLGLQVLRCAVRGPETRLVLAGHSFGSCGTVFASSRSAYIREKVSGQVLLDLWGFPLDQDTISGGLQVLPALSVLTGQFAENDEVHITKQLLTATASAAAAAGPGKECTSLWVPGTLREW